MNVIERTPVEPTMPPGIYHDNPPEMRCAWDCPRISDIVAVAQGYSLAYVRYWMLHKRPPTPATTEGTLLHMAVIQPDLWESEIGDAPVNPKTGKPFGSDTQAYNAALGQWKADHPEGWLLTPDERAKIEGWRDAVLRCPAAAELIEATPPDWRETTLVWEEPTTGLIIRVRLDGYSPPPRVIWDLKTCSGVMAGSGLLPAELQRNIDEHGYDIQAAVYLSALNDLGENAQDMQFIFFDKGNANEVLVRGLTPEYVDMAEQDMLWALDRLADAYARDCWPSYSSAITQIEPRRFRRRVRAA